MVERDSRVQQPYSRPREEEKEHAETTLIFITLVEQDQVVPGGTG